MIFIVTCDIIYCNRADNAGSQREASTPRRHGVGAREGMLLVVEGRSSSEIADALHLSPKTVETHRSRLMEKLGVENVAGLVKFAVQHGLTRPE